MMYRLSSILEDREREREREREPMETPDQVSSYRENRGEYIFHIERIEGGVYLLYRENRETRSLSILHAERTERRSLFIFNIERTEGRFISPLHIGRTERSLFFI